MIIAFPFYVVILIYAIKTRPEKAALLNKARWLYNFRIGFSGLLPSILFGFSGFILYLSTA